MGRLLGVVASLIMAAGTFAAPAAADIPGYPDIPGCFSYIIFGLDPHYRTVCDQSIEPDGSWHRFGQDWAKEYVHSSCNDYSRQAGIDYSGASGYDCPAWVPKDRLPAYRGPVQEYDVTADTVPPGEPGYIGG